MSGGVFIGVGGWTFEPWRGVFYPPGLTQAKELEYASRHLTSIEINGTYYGSQSPETFKKWREATPDGFIFSVKGSRFVTNRKVLGEAKESIGKFIDQGLLELEDRLGPILWQFAPTKKFDPGDVAAFLDLLPARAGGRALRHVIEARHDSFISPTFIALLRERGIGLVYAEHFTYPEMADVTADFVYARLQKGSDEIETAYPAEALEGWAGRFKAWAAGGQPEDLPLADPASAPAKTPRDVFAYVIHEGKIRAPAAAMALIDRVREAP
ncbi:MAG TPA: DUF72 domain-containing protein [Caulobacteraceae bacterium]|nr:DUF72 domain-containing protein [Caulobacteraceae bacterium]